MKAPKRRYNPKRRIAERVPEQETRRLCADIGYGGNPEHKRNPGDFGLTPPAQPRADKTLCDTVEVFERERALAYLRLGIERGLVSEFLPGGWPQNIWSMTESGQPLEAQLENSTLGTYHGYPLPDTDPFAEVVRERWHPETVDDQ